MLKTDGRFPVMSATDIGGWALAAFKDPEQWIGTLYPFLNTSLTTFSLGKDMKLASEWVTLRSVASTISTTLGEKVEVDEIDEAKWQELRTERFEEIWLNLQTFYTANESEYRDVELSRRLLPGAKTTESVFKAWGTSLIK